ncbi:MAG: hypothetical protein L0Z63_09335 [Actinobacteria bacterium]|nr:hypothetical protein [Actinomycetota bacterium]
MTATQPVIGTWATGVFGKTARALIAVGGLGTAVLLMLLASYVDEHAWVVVLMAATLAATSARAARYPTFHRLVVLLVNLLVIPTFAALT